jgi:hypothetical protein
MKTTVDSVRMQKTNFKVWRHGLILGKVWVSIYRGIQVHKRIDSKSSLSHSFNFFTK